MRRISTLASLATLALASCNQAGDPAKEAGAAAVEAAAPTVAAPAAGSPPGPTPGLWRVATRIEGMPDAAALPTVETCIREGGFEPPQDPASQAPGMRCEPQAYRREGDVLVGRSACTSSDGVRMESDMRISGDFKRRYTMEIHTTFTPAPDPAMASRTITMTAERLGDCPASAAQ